MTIQQCFQKSLTPFICSLLLLLGGMGRLGAVPQPTLEGTQAEQLRTLPFGISSGSALVIHSRQVEKVINSGAGSSSRYGFAEEGGVIKEGLWMRFHNAGSESWSSSAVEFAANVDVSHYNSLVLWVRALQGGQRFLVTFQDRGWKDKVHPQGMTPYFPLWGLPQDKILQVVIPFKAINYNASVDFARLSRLGFQFGRKTAGNGEGDIIEILGVAFVQQKEDPGRILFVDLSGAIEKHPSVAVKAIAPQPTHYPKQENIPKQPAAKSSPIHRSKSNPTNFAMEPTYFEPVTHGIVAFRSPSDDAQPVAVLDEGISYLALRSQKIEQVTWFLLDVDANTSGWVPSTDVQLSTHPPADKAAESPAPGKK